MSPKLAVLIVWDLIALMMVGSLGAALGQAHWGLVEAISMIAVMALGCGVVHVRISRTDFKI